MMFFLYNLVAMPFLKVLAWFLEKFASGKLAETAKGQRRSLQQLRESLDRKSPGGPVLWFHVSSAGEFLQAKPVIESLKKMRPDLYVAVSFFSPSGMIWAKKFPQADFIGYCPIDSRHNVREWLRLLKPKCLIMVKFDVWPNMVIESHKMGVATFLISATLTSKSRRHQSSWRRNFFKKIYSSIDHIYCVGEEDLRLFQQTNPQHPDLKIFGDTRVDSVLDRQKLAAEGNLSPHLEALKKEYPFILIVGSSWEADEELLFPAWAEFRKNHPQALMILAPHEPNQKHLSHTKGLAETANLRTLAYSKYLAMESGKIPAEVLVVDQVGLLADLYRIGDGAFVGAGQGGVHNTMEPAAWGLPVTFRPVYHNSPEAIAMLAADIFEVADDSNAGRKIFEKWLVNFQKSRDLGKKGREFLEKSQGATYKCSQSIMMELK